MRKGIRAVTILIIVAMVSACLTGCSLFGGKARSEITAAAELYAQAIKDYDVETQTRHMEPGHNAVSTLEIDPLQREIIDTVMSVTSFTVKDAQGSTKDAKGSAVIVFTIPDVEALAATEEAQGYSKDELLGAITATSQKKEVELPIDFVFEFDSWLVCAASTEKTAQFISNIGRDMEVKAISDAEAIAVAEGFIGYLADSDITSASTIYTSPEGTIFDEEVRSSLPGDMCDNVLTLYSTLLSGFDHETSVSALDETSVKVTCTGTAPDLSSAREAVTEDEAVMTQIYKAAIDSSVNDAEFDTAVIYDPLLEALSSAGDAPFEISFIVSIDDTETKSIAFDTTCDGYILINSPEALLYDEALIDLYLPIAAQELLDEEVITQEQYSEITGRYSADIGEDGITVDYEGGDNFYGFGYEIKDDGILVRVTTWGFYDQGTQFDYEILREPAGGESETVTGEAGIGEDNGDDMYLTVELSEEEFEIGGVYTLTVFDQDGETILVTAVFTIPVPESESEEDEEADDSEETEESGEDEESSEEETSETEETTDETDAE